jgi:hypothetical protein
MESLKLLTYSSSSFSELKLIDWKEKIQTAAALFSDRVETVTRAYLMI